MVQRDDLLLEEPLVIGLVVRGVVRVLDCFDGFLRRVLGQLLQINLQARGGVLFQLLVVTID